MRLHRARVARSILAIVFLIVWGACATVPKALPEAFGEDAANDVGEAYGRGVLEPCQIPVITASVSVRGSWNDNRLRGRLWVGVHTGTGSLRIESLQAAGPSYVFVAPDALHAPNEFVGTLFIPRRNLVVERESSRAVLEAMLGLPLSAREFVWAITGCPNLSGGLDGKRFGTTMMKIVVEAHGDDHKLELFLRRENEQLRGHLSRCRAPFPAERSDGGRTTRVVWAAS